MLRRFVIAFVASVSLVAVASADTPLTTAFTYQGQLKQGSTPYNGSIKLGVKLYDSVTGGALLGSQILTGVGVANGLFTVALNGGGELGATAFNGSRRWLEISVNDSLLTPRQELTAAPYAAFATAPWVLSGTSISYTAGSVGIGSTPPSYAALYASSAQIAGEAVRGDAPNGSGVVGTSSASGYGAVEGTNTSSGGSGVYGYNYASSNYGILGTGNEGVLGTSSSGVGVNGQTTGGTGVNGAGYNGLWGTSYSLNGNGLRAECHNGASAYGVWGYSTTGWAGVFSGNAQVTGNLYAGAKYFRIDDPLDPANKMLVHSCVESDEMKDMYDGVATLDAAGEASVELPAWFESLNENFRYQLTCIGQPALVYVKQEISGNRFLIAGGRPGMKVSWQVSGARHDAYAKAHPMQVEVAKEGADRGQYLHPEAFGLPASRSMEYAKIQAAHAQQAAARAPVTVPRPPQAATGR